MKFTKLWDFDKVSSREFALYFLVYLFSCLDHFIGVFDYSVGRSIYYGVHGQREEHFWLKIVLCSRSLTNREIRHFRVAVVQWGQRKVEKSVMRCKVVVLLLFFYYCLFFAEDTELKKQRTRSDVEFTLKFKAIIFQPQTQLDFETKRTVHDGRIRLNIKSIMWLCNKLYLAIFRFNK